MNDQKIKQSWAVLLAVSLCLCVAAAPAQAQLRSQPPGQLQTDLPLPYVAQVAEVAPAAHGRPLVIFLHGAGSNENDLFELKGQFSPDYDYLSVRAPIIVQPGSYQWFNRNAGARDYQAEEKDVVDSERLLLDFIRKASAKYHAAPGKVVLIGFSQGAMMSYQIGLRHPGSVAGIAALSGRILPQLKAELALPRSLGRLAVFIGHGTSDQRLPLSGATEAQALLEQVGFKPELRSYFGMAHAVNRNEIDDVKIWLAKTLAE